MKPDLEAGRVSVCEFVCVCVAYNLEKLVCLGAAVVKRFNLQEATVAKAPITWATAWLFTSTFIYLRQGEEGAAAGGVTGSFFEGQTADRTCDFYQQGPIPRAGWVCIAEEEQGEVGLQARLSGCR